jgi:hypothetical protein
MSSSSNHYVQTDGENKIYVPTAETGNVVEGIDYRFFLHRYAGMLDTCFALFVLKFIIL